MARYLAMVGVIVVLGALLTASPAFGQREEPEATAALVNGLKDGTFRVSSDNLSILDQQDNIVAHRVEKDIATNSAQLTLLSPLPKPSLMCSKVCLRWGKACYELRVGFCCIDVCEEYHEVCRDIDY